MIIGGISLTHLTAYDGSGGCPHMHAVSDEAYLVLSGRGRVEFHDLNKGMWTENLLPGRFVQFGPGVLHRLINDGDLVILAILSNAGLAESGDARIWFGTDLDESSYRQLAILPHNPTLADALARRDRAQSAYQNLVAAWHEDRDRWSRDLRKFQGDLGQQVQGLNHHWIDIVKRSHTAWGKAALQRLNNLPGIGNVPMLAQSVAAENLPTHTKLGMCGVLRCLA